MTILNALGLDGRLALKPYLQIGLSLLALKLAVLGAITPRAGWRRPFPTVAQWSCC